MAEKTSDEVLAERAKRGDNDALAELVERYRSKLGPFALRYFHARRDARDLARDALAETFINVWRHILTFDSKRASFSTWIHAIAKNICLSMLDGPPAASLDDPDVARLMVRFASDRWDVPGYDDYFVPLHVEDYIETHKGPPADPVLKAKNKKILQRLKYWDIQREGPKGSSPGDMNWVGKSIPGVKLSAREETIRRELAMGTSREELSRKLKTSPEKIRAAIHRIIKKNQGKK